MMNRATSSVCMGAALLSPPSLDLQLSHNRGVEVWKGARGRPFTDKPGPPSGRLCLEVGGVELVGRPGRLLQRRRVPGLKLACLGRHEGNRDRHARGDSRCVRALLLRVAVQLLVLARLLVARDVLRVGVRRSAAGRVGERDLQDEPVALRLARDGADEVAAVGVGAAGGVEVGEGEDGARRRGDGDARLRKDRLTGGVGGVGAGEVEDERRVGHHPVPVLVAVLPHRRRAGQIPDERQAGRDESRGVDAPRLAEPRDEGLGERVARHRDEGAPLRLKLVHLADARHVCRLVGRHFCSQVLHLGRREEALGEPDIGRGGEALRRDGRLREVGGGGVGGAGEA
mmetsp:Transcript_5408/g.17397  ORF Transcript_5408/g.17397 Transcript_5408/m.17397 type:complete len:342 (-) Transcript_5408:54-1079(-)